MPRKKRAGRGIAPSNKALSIIGILFIAFVLFDILILSGDTIHRSRIVISSNNITTFEVNRVGESHLIEIKTKHHVSASVFGTKGIILEMEVKGPKGDVVAQYTEHTPNESHYLRFFPMESGTYTLLAKKSEGAISAGSLSGKLKIYVNDKSIFKRVFEALVR